MDLNNRAILAFLILLSFFGCKKSDLTIREWKTSLILEDDSIFDTLKLSSYPFFRNVSKMEEAVESYLGSGALDRQFAIKRFEKRTSLKADFEKKDVYYFVLFNSSLGECDLIFVQGVGLVYVNCLYPYYLISESLISSFGDTISYVNYFELTEQVFMSDSTKVLELLNREEIVEID